MTTLYIEHNRVIGQGEGSPWFNPHAKYGRTAYLCPKCGEVWARVETGSGEWTSVRQSCRLCPPFANEVPGSFLLSWNWQMQLQDFPKEVLAREFLLHLSNESLPS